jgi:hypothetical protein
MNRNKVEDTYGKTVISLCRASGVMSVTHISEMHIHT